MNLFSKIFGAKPADKTFKTNIGVFTLSKQAKRYYWVNREKEFMMSVRGADKEPNSEQINFLENIDNEIKILNDRITKKFIKEFAEADINIDFSFWQERFKIVGVEVMIVFQGNAYWNITFEDLKTPFAHFTIYIEGKNLTDFSIDT